VAKPKPKPKRPIGKTTVAVFTEKKEREQAQVKKLLKRQMKALDLYPKRRKKMMTTKNIIKEEEAKKPEEKKDKSIFVEEGVKRATHKAETPWRSPAEPVYLSPAEAAAKEVRETRPAAQAASVIEPPVEEESSNQRLLRVIRTARERLRGRGMPELDVELDELIEEMKGAGDK
jgi:hypothetical protein